MKRVYVILALCAVLFAGWANLACDTAWEVQHDNLNDPGKVWLAPVTP